MGILSKLKNGDTAFRSLPYGKDRPNGGNSSAPYITTPIPGLDQNPGPPNVEDSILRGSLKAPISAKDDVLRLTKYFFDFKNIDGYLFTTKQNILSRTAPKAENAFGPAYGGFSKLLNIGTGITSFNPNSGFFNEGIYTPLSTILQAGAGYLGTHYNKQGVDPTGAFTNLSIQKYGEIAYQNNLPENNNYNDVVPLSLWKGWMKKEQQVDKLGIKVGDTNTAYYEQLSYQPTPPIPPVKNTPGQLLVNSKGVPDYIKNLPQTIANIKYVGDKAKYALQKTKFNILTKWDNYQEKRKFEKYQRTQRRYNNALQEYQNLGAQLDAEANKTRYNNRLLQLWRKGGLDPADPWTPSEYNQILYSYSGGPDSTLGIGNTVIKTGTLNDGITPARTGVLRGNDPYYNSQNDALEFKRPTVTFSTSNIFENTYGLSKSSNNSVSLIYASLIDVDEEELFSDITYLSNDEKLDITSPWSDTESKLIYGVSQYQKQFGLSSILSSGVQIPISKDKVYTQDPKTPLGATSKFIEIYNSDSNLIDELGTKTFIILNEDGFHQTWVLADDSGAPLNNRSSETDDPYSTSQHSKDLTPGGKIYPDGKDRNYEDLEFTFSDRILFNRYTGASYKYNNANTFLGSNNQNPINPQEKITDTSVPNPKSRNDKVLNQAQINQKSKDSFYGTFTDANPHPSFKKTREEETAFDPNRFPRIRHEERVSTGDPGQVEGSYNQPLDTINAVPVYKSKGDGAGRGELNDFVHFRIGIVDGKTNGGLTYYMNFRSYIDSFSDSYNANWTDIKYMGRGEPFKRYSDFGRTINMSFTVVATSQAEMYGIYDKLRLLATSIAPSYTGAGYMTGNFAKLTVGGYVFEQYGIITGFTYEIPEEASWELTIGAGAAVGDELPMMIKVTGFTFVPIYSFLPQFTDNDGFRWISRRIPTSAAARANRTIEYADPPLKNSDIEWNATPSTGSLPTPSSNTNTGTTNTNSSPSTPSTPLPPPPNPLPPIIIPNTSTTPNLASSNPGTPINTPSNPAYDLFNNNF